MILESIILRNFRQYYGTQVIEFSQSPVQNVTVIHGENGAGKTALLNAFSWCLYEKLNLPNPQNIVNEHAIEEAPVNDEVECFVTIRFKEKVKDDGGYEKHYSLTRRVKARKYTVNKVAYTDPEVRLEYKEDGQSKVQVANVSSEVSRILPEELSSYFFFDGERIDNLTKDSGTEEIQKAIKNMMGLEILQRSIAHTDKAMKKILGELKQFGNPQTVHLVEEKEQLEERRDELLKEMQEYKHNLSLVRGQVHNIEDELRKTEGAKHLQNQRDEKKKELKELENEIEVTQKELRELMSKNGYLAYGFAALDKVMKILASETYKDSNYVGVNTSFINQLIERQQCICGTHLMEGSEVYGKVASVKNYLAPISLDHAIAAFQGEARLVREKKETLLQSIDSLKQREYSMREKSRLLNENIEEIGKQLSDKDSANIIDLESKRKNLEQQWSDIERKIGALQEQIISVEEQIQEKTKAIKEINKTTDKVELVKKRVSSCEELISVMTEIYALREKIVQEQLQERVSIVYSRFLRKGYQIRLNTDYELEVINNSGNKVGMSQGERQITSLSFIGAIVDIAREQFNKEQSSAFEEGGIYPIVMDSPFGALDSDHRDRIALGIPTLANQVIVIVSTSQWRGEVAERLKDRIGGEYRLHYNDPRKNEDQPYEFTEIEEVIQ